MLRFLENYYSVSSKLESAEKQIEFFRTALLEANETNKSLHSKLTKEINLARKNEREFTNTILKLTEVPEIQEPVIEETSRKVLVEEDTPILDFTDSDIEEQIVQRATELHKQAEANGHNISLDVYKEVVRKNQDEYLSN